MGCADRLGPACANVVCSRRVQAQNQAPVWHAATMMPTEGLMWACRKGVCLCAAAVPSQLAWAAAVVASTGGAATAACSVPGAAGPPQLPAQLWLCNSSARRTVRQLDGLSTIDLSVAACGWSSPDVVGRPACARVSTACVQCRPALRALVRAASTHTYTRTRTHACGCVVAGSAFSRLAPCIHVPLSRGNGSAPRAESAGRLQPEAGAACCQLCCITHH
jgi:hypothetical protein